MLEWVMYAFDRIKKSWHLEVGMVGELVAYI